MTRADRIRIIRKHKNLSQEKLAEMLGYSGKTSISKIEKSGDDVTLKTLEKVKDALETSVPVLLGYEDYIDEGEVIIKAENTEDIIVNEKIEIVSPKLRKYVQDANSMYAVEDKVQKLVDMAKSGKEIEVPPVVSVKSEPEETLLLALYRLLNKDNKQSLSNIIQNMIAKQTGEEGSTT